MTDVQVIESKGLMGAEGAEESPPDGASGGGGPPTIVASPNGATAGAGEPSESAPAESSGGATQLPDTCANDVDCGVGTALCLAGECVPCETPAACPTPWPLVVRNGCSWCVPPRACTRDADCGAGLICYAGRVCDSGCSGDPGCCYGNVCAASGCATTEGLDCARVGCLDGDRCEFVWPGVSCSCNDGVWECPRAIENACVTL